MIEKLKLVCKKGFKTASDHRATESTEAKTTEEAISENEDFPGLAIAVIIVSVLIIIIATILSIIAYKKCKYLE